MSSGVGTNVDTIIIILLPLRPLKDVQVSIFKSPKLYVHFAKPKIDYMSFSFVERRVSKI